MAASGSAAPPGDRCRPGAAMADPLEPIVLKFGGGINRRPRAYDINPEECFTGENFDLDIMERNLFAAVDQLVSLAPPAKHALVVSVGDYFHSDGQNNTTTKGTRVDVDGRTAKMIAVGIRTMRRVIDRGLKGKLLDYLHPLLIVFL